MFFFPTKYLYILIFYAIFVNKNNQHVLCLRTTPKIDLAKRNLTQRNTYDLRISTFYILHNINCTHNTCIMHINVKSITRPVLRSKNTYYTRKYRVKYYRT